VERSEGDDGRSGSSHGSTRKRNAVDYAVLSIGQRGHSAGTAPLGISSPHCRSFACNFFVVFVGWHFRELIKLWCLYPTQLQMRTAPQSFGCRDPGFSDCRLCKGESRSDWVPLCDPVRTTPHVFSPYNTNR
jgi:hypothetical protein